jgi:drug/metabolite transporter (DMT)-like permease
MSVDSRKTIDTAAMGLMLLICLAWALQQIGLKATAELASPVFQVGLRSGVAAALVFMLIGFQRQTIQLIGKTAALGVVAGLLFAVEFVLVGEALKHTSASHVVVFLYTAPIFAALGLHWKLPSEQLAHIQWGGIAVAAIGIAYAFLAPTGSAHRTADLNAMLLGDGLALLGGAAWGVTTVVIRTTRLSSIPAAHVLFYQLATAFAVLVGFAAVKGETSITLSQGLILNLAFQTIIVSFLSLLAWFWLLGKYRASQLGVFSFLTPLFGVLLGVAFLGEPVTVEFLTGASCVLFGIAVVSAYPWASRLLARRLANRNQGYAPVENP